MPAVALAAQGSVRGDAGSASPGHGRAGSQHAGCRSPWQGHRSDRRSPLRPRFGVRALGDEFQERVCFSHDLQRHLRALQLGLEPDNLPAGPAQLHITSRPPISSRSDCETGQSAAVTLLTPLRQMRRVQTLTPQERAPVRAALRQSVVRVQVGVLLNGGEGPPWKSEEPLHQVSHLTLRDRASCGPDPSSCIWRTDRILFASSGCFRT